ncbi:MAG: hypothetical protein K8F90_12670 [Hyphomicrobiales bacterium]|nr:hypothetical protein [Hyphomicrobiales bacterium]
MLASAAILAGPASAGEIFNDDFDNPSLDGKWTVVRPAEGSFAVENGQLLLISSKPGELSDNTIENILMPNVKLPAGNWTMTVKFSGEFQTAREELGLGVMDTETSYVTAGIATQGDQYYGWALSAFIGRMLDKDSHRFQRALASMGCNVCAKDKMFPDFAATIPQPIEAKLEKRGQQYIVSAKLGVDSKEWTTLERIIAINAGGKPVLFLRQAGKVTGETLVKIDSFKIESNE